MALIGVHRLQRHAAAVLEDLAGHLVRQTLQTLFTLGPVVLGVHMDPQTLIPAAVYGIVGELLDGVQRLSPAADESAQLLTHQDHLVAVLLLLVHLHLSGAFHML